MEAGEVFVAAHLDEAVHGQSGEADEVQVAGAAADGQVAQLQVHVADARLAVGRVGGQVAADALQVLHLLLLLLRCDVFGLEIDQLHQRPTDVHAKPGEGW